VDIASNIVLTTAPRLKPILYALSSLVLTFCSLVILDAIVVMDGIITPKDSPAKINDIKKIFKLFTLSKINDIDRNKNDKIKIFFE
jgi:hypothetical protein